MTGKRRYIIRLLPDRNLPRELRDYVERESEAWAERLRISGPHQRSRRRLLREETGVGLGQE